MREDGTVPRDETTVLRVEYDGCDEDSSFMVRIMDELPEDLRPGKLSDGNHLANTYFLQDSRLGRLIDEGLDHFD